MPDKNIINFTTITSSLILLLFFFVTACVTATTKLGYLFMFLNNVVSILPILFIGAYLSMNSEKSNGYIYFLLAICGICWLFELITSIIYMVIFVKMRFLKFSSVQRKHIFRNTRVFIAEWIFYMLACGVLLYFILNGVENTPVVLLKTQMPMGGISIGFLFGAIAFILASIRMGLTVELLNNVKRTTLRHEPVGTCTNNSSI